MYSAQPAREFRQRFLNEAQGRLRGPSEMLLVGRVGGAEGVRLQNA